ncbi:hypothetical protein [Chitinophaga qingshengii]|uniref:HTH hxlR-type domain-containing protein n=1 Tax=Chitinophaga qingshengii TaxID=1569794 RepID=A0ABR7TXE2_9BACT|nr:hypothetical protein [Chitinophaga qingshengii]
MEYSISKKGRSLRNLPMEMQQWGSSTAKNNILVKL